jgi:hypothetical protein
MTRHKQVADEVDTHADVLLVLGPLDLILHRVDQRRG